MDPLIAVLFSDAVQGADDVSFLLVRGSEGKKGKLRGGRRKITEPHLHEPDPHAAPAGFEEKLLKGRVKIEVPHARPGKKDVADHLFLVRVPEVKPCSAGIELPLPQLPGAMLHQAVKDSQEHGIVVFILRKGHLLGDHGLRAGRVDRRRIDAESSLVDHVSEAAEDEFQAAQVKGRDLADQGDVQFLQENPAAHRTHAGQDIDLQGSHERGLPAVIHIQHAFGTNDPGGDGGDQLVARHAHGSCEGQLGLDVPPHAVGRVFGSPPETVCACHVQVDVTGVGGLPEGRVPGRHARENANGFLRELRVRGQHGQPGAELDGLPERHALENALFSSLRGNIQDECPLRVDGSHGHRAVPELRPGHPGHRNGKSRDVNVYDVPVHDFKRPYHGKDQSHSRKGI